MVAIWIRSWNFVKDTFLIPTYRNNSKHAEQCSRTGGGFVQFWFGVTVVDVNDWGTPMCLKNTLPLFFSFSFLFFFYREIYKKERRFLHYIDPSQHLVFLLFRCRLVPLLNQKRRTRKMIRIWSERDQFHQSITMGTCHLLLWEEPDAILNSYLNCMKSWQ